MQASEVKALDVYFPGWRMMSVHDFLAQCLCDFSHDLQPTDDEEPDLSHTFTVNVHRGVRCSSLPQWCCFWPLLASASLPTASELAKMTDDQLLEVLEVAPAAFPLLSAGKRSQKT